MSLLKTWKRLILRKRGKNTADSAFAAPGKTLRKLAAAAAGLGFLATTNISLGSTITKHNPGTTITQNGDVYKIETNTVSGNNAFNSFHDFNLSTGHTANFHLPTNTSNLINFVKSQIQVDGTINAIKGSQIGGNLYFLSAQGLVVGSTGVINCGALFAITPTSEFMEKFVRENTLVIEENATEIGHITSRKFVNHNGVKAGDGIPINSAGSIVISGRVNAIDNVGAVAGTVTLNGGARIDTGVVDFSALVNTDNIPGISVSGLEMTTNTDGNVELVAVADTSGKASSITKLGTGFSEFGKAEAHAKVTVNGTVNAKLDASFEAVAANGKLDGSETVFEYGQTREVETFAGGNPVADIKATVEVGATAAINAENDVLVNAIANNFYKNGGVNILDLGLSIAGMTSPVNIAGEVAVTSTKATVDVAQGASIAAAKDVKIKALSRSDIIVGASTSLAKIKRTPSGAAAAVVYADVSNEAAVTVNGSLSAGTEADPTQGDIFIDARAEVALDATGAAKTANDNSKLATGVVIADVSNKSNVQIGSSAMVAARKNLTVRSETRSDVSTVAIVETGDESYLGAAVNYTEFDSDAQLTVNSDLTAAAGNIDLSAYNLVLQSRSTAESTVGHTKISKALDNLQSNLVASIFSLTKFSSKFTGTLGEDTGTKFRAAGAIVFAHGSHNASVKLGGNVEITAGEKLVLKSSAIIEDIFLKADSIARSKMNNAEGDKTSVSAGILYSDISQNSEVNIADASHTIDGNGSTLTGKTVEISSLAKIEYNRVKRMIQAVEDAVATLKDSVSGETQLELIDGVADAYQIIKDNFADLGAEGLTSADKIDIFIDSLASLSSMAGALGDLIAGESKILSSAAKIVTSAADFAVYGNYLNMSAASAIKGANEENSADIGFSGAVGLTDFTTRSEVIVGRNVALSAVLPPADVAEPVKISALTDVDTISAAGHLIPSSGAKSFGGTYFSQDFISVANVTVAEGSDISAANKDIAISAGNDSKTVVAGFASAMAGSGVEGMVTRLTGNSEAAVNIDDEVGLAARDIKLGALNNTKVVNIAGSVMISSAVGVSAGVAINDFVKDSIVFVGDIDEKYQDSLDEKSETDKATTDNSLRSRTDATITATGLIEAEARSTGRFTAVGVAGGITKNDDSGSGGFFSDMAQKYNNFEDSVSGTINSLGSKFSNVAGELSGKTSNKSSGTHKNPEFSLSVAGSVALNFIENTTKADISGATIELGATADSNLNVMAVNNTDLTAFAGSAGLMWQKATQDTSGKSVGIAGAVGLNSLTNTTEAIVRNSDIKSADQVNVFAINGGTNVAAGLGLQVSKNSGNADGAFTMGGSVSINGIDNTVKAEMIDTAVTGEDARKTDVKVTAYESDLQITGGVQLTVGKQKGAFGAAVNVANISNDVTARIDGGNYAKVADVSASALQALTQVNGALTAGIIWGTDDSVAIMGAAVYNQLDNILKAEITGATITASGDVSANTRDFRTAEAVSGYEQILNRFESDAGAFISTDGADYYDVDASNDADGPVDPLTGQPKNGALIVSGAMAISSADTAVGAAVVINDINNEFDAKIENSTISAEAINTRSYAQTFLVSAAGGIAVSTDNGAGGGSVIWNEIDNQVKSGALKSTLNSNSVKFQAENASRLIAVAGQISAGAGNAAVGMALSYNDIVNTTDAYSFASIITGQDTADSQLLVEADNSVEVLDIAASIAASEKVGIGGSVAINKIANDTRALVDKSFVDENEVTQTNAGAALTGFKTLRVKAEDNSELKSLAGTVAGGGDAGIGGSVAYNEISGTTGAAIDNITLNAENVLVKSRNDAAISTLAAGLGGAGKVAVQGAAATGEISRTIYSRLNAAQINNVSSSVDVVAESCGAINSSAAVVSVGGKAGVGAGVSVNRIDDTVNASVSGGTLNLKDLDIRSKASQTIRTIGAAGSGGASFGVSGSVAVNKINTVNSAFIDGNASITAEDNVGVVAQTDDNLMNYAGLLSVGGNAGIGAAVGVNHILGDTEARIENAAVSAKGLGAGITADSVVSDDKMNDGFISDQSVNIGYTLEQQRSAVTKTGVVVDSSATHTLKSFIANAAGAGTAALAGTVNVSQIDGNTNAVIRNTTVNNGISAGDVTVNAADYTNMSGFVGSVGGAGTVGIGASSDTGKVNRNTSARVDNVLTGSKAKDMKVNSVAKQGLSSFAAGLGVGGTTGIAGTVSVAMLSGTTEAIVANSLITLDSLQVNADHWCKVSVLDTTAAVAGYAGIGGAVAVNDIRDKVKAEISDSTIGMSADNAGEISVKAKNYALLNATTASLGGGLAGVAGNVAVNYMENQVTAIIKNSTLATTQKRATSITVKAENSANIDSDIGTVALGGVGAGASVGVNTLDGKVRAEVDKSSLYAKGNISVAADESRTVDQHAFTVAGGGLGLAGNVMILTSGQLLSEDNSDGNVEIRNAVTAAEQVNNGSIGGTNGALTAEEQTALNGTSNNLSSQEAGKSATTVSVGGTAANKSVLNSSEGSVAVKATENTVANLTGGSGAIGGSAAGGSVGIVDLNRNVGTTISYATINAGADIDVASEVKGNAGLNMYQGSAGIFAAGTAAYGSVSSAGNALTAVSNSSFVNSGNILIGAKDVSGAEARSYGLTAGTIAAGVLVTQIDNSGAVNVNLNANNMIAAK